MDNSSVANCCDSAIKKIFFLKFHIAACVKTEIKLTSVTNEVF